MNQFYCFLFTALVLLLQFVAISISVELFMTPEFCSECKFKSYYNQWTEEIIYIAISYPSGKYDYYPYIQIDPDETTVDFDIPKRRVETINGSTYPDDIKLVKGSAIYLNNDTEPWCNWTIAILDSSFEIKEKLIKPAELIGDRVIVHLNEITRTHPFDISLLPDQMVQQFKDYKVTGNSKVQLFYKVGWEIDFVLAGDMTIPSGRCHGSPNIFPESVTVSLVNAYGNFTVQCRFNTGKVDGHFLIDGIDCPLFDVPFSTKQNSKITRKSCKWKLLNYGSAVAASDYIFTLFPKNYRKFNLTIVANERSIIFNDPDFKLIGYD